MKIIDMYKAVLGAICCLSFALSLHAQSPQEKGLQSISRTSAKAIVGFLADDELQGREAGMHGSRLAARYLASCLKEAGIAPLEKDNYYQPFEAYNKERQQRGRWQVHPDSIAILKQGVHRILQMSNVLGTIPGERPDEYVIVGAHFDHLGVDETLANDRIYNGADDNASGVSAVLQIARAFLATGQKPLRTVIFAFWDGEEKGLLGSKYFVQSCPFISQVKGYLNFDMIGRNNKPEQPQHVVLDDVRAGHADPPCRQRGAVGAGHGGAVRHWPLPRLPVCYHEAPAGGRAEHGAALRPAAH